MSDHISEERAAESPVVAPPAAAAKKPRSKVELAIVWGGIGVLLLLVGIQGVAYSGYMRTVSPLKRAVRDSDESENRVVESTVQGLIRGKPQFTPGTYSISERKDTYVWKGLFRNYTLRVIYGIKGGGKINEPEVMNIETN